MKRIPQLILFLLLTTGITKAQPPKKINEGRITYMVNYELPADKQQFAGALPKEITCYFRGDSTATTVEQAGATIKSVQHYKTGYQSLMIEIPAASKKILVILTPAEIQQMDSADPKLIYTRGTEKQVIGGYNCTKVTATNPKNGAKYDVWITKDVDIVPNSLSHFVNDLGGLPVRFVTFNEGVKVNAEIEIVKEVIIPKGFFSATKDYQKMSMAELKSLTNPAK